MKMFWRIFGVVLVVWLVIFVVSGIALALPVIAAWEPSWGGVFAGACLALPVLLLVIALGDLGSS